MIKIKRNWKEIEGSLLERNRSENRAKTEQKQGKNKALRDFAASAKSTLCCKTSSQPQAPLCKTTFGTRVPLRSTGASISQLRIGCEALKRENSQICSQSSIWQGISQLRNQLWHTSAISQHSDSHFAAAKWLWNLYTLKSFSAHAMNRHVTTAPPFWKLLETSRSLPEVQIMNSISRFKYWEVRSP